TGQAVGNQLGKHRQHTLRQVHAGAAHPGLAVQYTSRGDKVADVRDVDAEQPVLAAGVLHQGGGVVEILSVGRAGGDWRVGGKILAAVEVALPKLRGSLTGFFEHLCRERVRQAEPPNDRKRVHARLAARPEHFRQYALAPVFRRGETEHLEDDLVLRSSALGPRIADEDAVAENRAIDADVSLTIALEIRADELPRGSFQHLEDFTARTEVAAVGLADDAHEHLVTGGGVLGVFGPDEDFRAGLAVDDMGPNEAEAVRRPPEDAGHGAVRLGRADRVVLPELEALLLDQVPER